MHYRLLGRTGVRVSQLCLGTMAFGGEADEATAAAMVRRARDAGVNFFDTADVYNEGRSEEILGRLLADCRDEIVLASKGYGRTGPGENSRGASRYHLVRAVEASLRRLRTDRIDVYYVHHFDPDPALEEVMRALDDLVRQGKVLYVGVSNFTAWQTMQCLGLARMGRLAPVACIQPMYNLVKRTAEIEILPMAQAEGLGVMPYGPVGGGLLSGRYGRDRRPEEGRLVSSEMYRRRYGADWMYGAAEAFTDFAQARGIHPVSLAVAWAGAHPAVTAPIFGGRSAEQIGPALDSVAVEMTHELRREIAALTPPLPSPTDRSEEAAG